jgi:outer membrane receptor protein involved in Fe transport
VGSVISERLTWGVACSNLFNTSYIPHLSLSRELGIAMPGRNISIRLSFVL